MVRELGLQVCQGQMKLENLINSVVSHLMLCYRKFHLQGCSDKKIANCNDDYSTYFTKHFKYLHLVRKYRLVNNMQYPIL